MRARFRAPAEGKSRSGATPGLCHAQRRLKRRFRPRPRTSDRTGGRTRSAAPSAPHHEHGKPEEGQPQAGPAARTPVGTQRRRLGGQVASIHPWRRAAVVALTATGHTTEAWAALQPVLVARRSGGQGRAAGVGAPTRAAHKEGLSKCRAAQHEQVALALGLGWLAARRRVVGATLEEVTARTGPGAPVSTGKLHEAVVVLPRARGAIVEDTPRPEARELRAGAAARRAVDLGYGGEGVLPLPVRGRAPGGRRAEAAALLVEGRPAGGGHRAAPVLGQGGGSPDERGEGAPEGRCGWGAHAAGAYTPLGGAALGDALRGRAWPQGHRAAVGAGGRPEGAVVGPRPDVDAAGAATSRPQTAGNAPIRSPRRRPSA